MKDSDVRAKVTVGFLSDRGPKIENGRITMAEQFENPEEEKVDDETADDLTPEQRAQREAERLAKKGAKREQEFDKEHNVISK
jgi:hypothetical protein